MPIFMELIFDSLGNRMRTQKIFVLAAVKIYLALPVDSAFC